MTVYALEDPTTSTVKIGYTAAGRPARRVSDIQVSLPRTLRLLWYGAGGREEERGLHRLLAPCRGRGEWFHDSDLLRLALIALPVVGARGLVATGREALLTFVPLADYVRDQPAWLPALHVARTGAPYWPEWTAEPY